VTAKLSFLQELKRRKVIRAGLVYGAVAWAVVQAADVFVPALGLPEWVLTAIALVSLLGLPLALALAWAFDLRDGGIERTPDAPGPVAAPADVSGSARIAAEGSPAWVSGRAAGAVAVALAIGVSVGWLAGRAPAEDGRSASEEDRPSIAVLPFTNLARDPEAAPFVEGLHDDLLTQLSRLERLRVISRTSVQEYRDTQKAIPDIAAELGVGHVLEGGVQRDGGRVRLNVQLIDGRTDEHLWAETFDRDLSMGGVFEIQSELAARIAESLADALSPAQVGKMATDRGTDDLAAWEEFQRGQALFRRSLVGEDVDRATEAFRAATRLDPEYLDAWARLAIAEATMSWEFARFDRLPRAEEAVARARALDPGHYLTRLASGYIRYYGYRQYEAALSELRAAERQRPGDPEVLQPIGWVLRRQGKWDEALRAFEAAFERDPRHFELVHSSLGYTHLFWGDAEKARRYLDLAEEIDPLFDGVYGGKALAAYRDGRGVAGMQDEIRRAPDASTRALALSNFEVVARAAGNRFEPELLAALRGPAPSPELLFGFLEAVSRLSLSPADAARRDALVARADSLSTRAGNWSYQGSLGVAAGLARARRGEGPEALARLDREVAAFVALGDAMEGPKVRYNQAAAHALAGDVDAALRILDEVVAPRGRYTPLELRIDPVWDPVRDDPRFQAIAARENEG
jgi:TolB-like protein/Tfp pilus assembly protein PilF